jgi:hypothetical protein
MFTPTLSRLFSASALFCIVAGLTACGGNADMVSAAPAPALAATVSHMPAADCEPQACQGLRIIDSNAETFRADNARREALAMAVARMDDDSIPLPDAAR